MGFAQARGDGKVPLKMRTGLLCLGEGGTWIAVVTTEYYKKHFRPRICYVLGG